MRFAEVAMMRSTVLAVALLIWNAAAHAAVVVDAAFVREAIERGALIWDVRAKQDYRKGHIPDAVSIGEAASELRDPNSEDFIAQSEIEEILGRAGIDPVKEVVVYGWRGSTTPHFARYALRYFGAQRVHVFHDGIEGWCDAGGASSVDEVTRPAVKLALKPVPDQAISTRDVIARLGRQDVQIVDARTPREFSGEDIRAIRGGHVPGAINIPYELNWRDPLAHQKLAQRQVDSSSGMSLKESAHLNKLYAALDPAKETVVMCHSGVRAAQTASVLQDLGFRNVRVYDSSWLGYAARLDAPAENEVFLNVGQMNQRLRELARRVDDLEGQLQQRKSATCINC
jgi:thiosulfate/3-mercaptopyruvate sulfurtransferase